MHSYNNPRDTCASRPVNLLGNPVVMRGTCRIAIPGQNPSWRDHDEAGQRSARRVIKRIFLAVDAGDVADMIRQISDKIWNISNILIARNDLEREIRWEITFHIGGPGVRRGTRYVVEISQS